MDLRIGEAARRVGVTPHALRHYENVGLLRPRRSQSGQRLYDEKDLARVRFIRRAAGRGFTLGEIAEVARLRSEGKAPCAWVRARLDEKIAAIEARIAELERLRAELVALRDGPPAEEAACCPVLERGNGGRVLRLYAARFGSAWRS